MVKMFPKDIYIDLGTDNTLIYARKKGILLNEPSIIGEYSKTASYKFGADAKKMLGKTPQNVSLCRPLEEGVIKNFEQAKRMLAIFLKNAENEMYFTKSRILISHPIELKKHEKECFRELAYETDAGIVDLISEPLAGAVGTGINIFTKKSFMFLDMGAGTTEVIVTFNGEIIRFEAVRIGGNDIDLAIADHLRNKFHFCVGEQTAENIKIQVANLNLDGSKPKSCKVSGIDMITGLPTSRFVDSTMIQPALFPTFNKISGMLTHFFNDCDPEIIADVFDNGIVTFGGNALIPGASQFFHSIFGIPFKRSANPLMSVTIGGAKILDDNLFFKNQKYL